MPLDAAGYAAALRQYAAGVVLLTVRDGRFTDGPSLAGYALLQLDRAPAGQPR